MKRLVFLGLLLSMLSGCTNNQGYMLGSLLRAGIEYNASIPNNGLMPIPKLGVCQGMVNGNTFTTSCY